MNKRKWFSILFGLTLIVGASGCSGSNSGGNASPSSSGTAPASPSASPSSSASSSASGSPSASADAEPLKYTIYPNYDWWTMQAWGDDPISKWIQDNKKVTIEPISSGGAAATKLNTMEVSGSLPDVIILERKDVPRFVENGQLVALDSYLDKYPNAKAAIGEKTLGLLRAKDGHIYMLPNWFATKPTNNAGWVVNMKIYTALGSPKLETFDDLEAYLKLVKEKYPDVVPLEVGFQGDGIDTLIYAGMAEDHPSFYANDSMFVYPDGDQLKPVLEDPALKEAWQFAARLFREKLITQDAFTQTNDQYLEKVNAGRVAVYATGSAGPDGEQALRLLKAKDPTFDYKVIWPLHKEGLDPNKIWPGNWNSLGWNAIVITQKAKDPERIFAFYDWLVSQEGQTVTFFGPKGLLWDDLTPDGVPIPNEYSKTISPDALEKIHPGQWTDLFGNSALVDRIKTAQEELKPADQQSWLVRSQQDVLWKTSMNVDPFVNSDPDPNSPAGIASTQMIEFFKQTFAKAIYAKDDAEVVSIMEKADADSNKFGFDKYVRFKNDKWHENLQKINGNS
ncbi:extracellular solute-binding protein [Cohnella zeiphila]|uniref:Extracellular solute-binding protein n=1 Tax=Cohnella zeiphila TaxID=2761120 RepID=A0A7X0SH87_9BACL|nr:extracellular solute-binding protein [Cohnella zeiphila]MBB6729806.1 extracellular solute-binding protein [Cohnella zeiphila]